MHFIIKMLIAKYGKEIAMKMWREYQASKRKGGSPRRPWLED